MPLLLDDDQLMLQDMARGFLAAHASAAHVRALRDDAGTAGFSLPLWAAMADQGLLGLMVGQDHGGLGLGHVDAGIVLEQMGRNLAMAPYAETAVTAVEALQGLHHADRWFPRIIAGNAVIAFAFEERSRHRREIGLRAERCDGGFRLTGRKQCVPLGHVADLLIVAARTTGTPRDHDGLSLFAVDGGTPGLRSVPAMMLDAGYAAELEFCDVEVPPDAIIGDIDHAIGPIVRLLNVGATAAAAELLGVAEGAYALTLSYLKSRHQFGAAIGSFQALQHRAAHLYSTIEVARSAVLKAQQALDDRAPETSQTVSVAKAMASDAATLAVQEGVQLHGGVGMTDAYDIGLFMKRARFLCERFGDTAFHADLVARLRRY